MPSWLTWEVAEVITLFDFPVNIRIWSSSIRTLKRWSQHWKRLRKTTCSIEWHGRSTITSWNSQSRGPTYIYSAIFSWTILTGKWRIIQSEVDSELTVRSSEACELLKHLFNAMEPNKSILLIDDFLDPAREGKLPLKANTLNLHLIAAFGRPFRTMHEWRDLFFKTSGSLSLTNTSIIGNGRVLFTLMRAA